MLEKSYARPYIDLPDHSTLWLYLANRELSQKESEEIRNKSMDFISQWNAHGNKLESTCELFYNRFLVFFVDEVNIQASGCSIDKSVHFVKELEKEYGVSFLDRQQVAYKKNGEIKNTTLQELPKLWESGDITKETSVFDNLIKTKGDFMNNWSKPIKDSWHWQFL